MHVLPGSAGRRGSALRLALLAAGVTLIMLGCAAPAAVPTPQPAPTPTDALSPGNPETPEETVAEFFKWYTLYPGNPLARGSYRTSEYLRPYLTAGLIQKVERTVASFDDQGAYDPFLCAQDVPVRFEVEVYEPTADGAIVLVHRYFGNNSQAYDMLVQVVESGDSWRISDILCSVPGQQAAPAVTPAALAPTDTATAALEATSTFRPGSFPEVTTRREQWNTYRSSFGFSISYPSGWNIHELDVSPAGDADPVDGFVAFSNRSGTLPIALMLSTGSMDSYRLIFPEPGNSERARVSEYEVIVEEMFGGEYYTIFLHPDDPDKRVALRVISRNEPPSGELLPVIERMVDSFRYTK